MNYLKKMIQNDKSKLIFLFGFYFLVPFLIYLGTILSGNVFVSGDGVGFFGFKIYFNQSIMQGQFPFWNPYLSNGIPFAMDQSFGQLYPISILISWLPLDFFILVYYSLHMAIAGFFMNLFMRELKCDKKISFVIGLIYILSIHMGGYRKNHMGIISTVVWIPVIFYFIQGYIHTKRVKFLVFSGIAMALQFLAGFIQCAFYTDIIVGIYLLYFMIQDKLGIKRIIKDGLVWGSTYIGLVCIQLVPMLFMMSCYESLGTIDTPFEFFKGWSISFRKLLMTIFPTVFGPDYSMPYGHLYSSEIDIELFLGTAIILLVVCGIIILHKHSFVKIGLLLMIGIYIYAANAHIPYLSEILYRIPLLGGFRVPSRILPLFIFIEFSILGLVLQYFKETAKKTQLLSYAVIGTICFTIIACLCYIFISNGIFSSNLSEFYKGGRIFVGPIVICIIICIGIYLYSKYETQKIFTIFLGVLVSVTLFQTFPYYHMYATVSSKEYMMDDSKKALKELIGVGNIWYASEKQQAYFTSEIGFNKGAVLEMPSLNSYVSLNNPTMYRLFNNNAIPQLNFSGLYTWFPAARANVRAQNGTLSMLGVNVIADQENVIDELGTSYTMGMEKNTIFEQEILQVPNLEGQLFVFSNPVEVKKNTFYKVAFDAEANKAPGSVYFDLCGENYDRGAQDVNIYIKEGKHHYENYVFTEDSDEGANIVARIVGTPIADINITNLKFIEMETIPYTGIYEKIYEGNGTVYYRNNNAKDLLYFTENVINVQDRGKIYNDVYKLDFINNSYIEGYDDKEGLDLGEIKIIDQGINSIKAQVECSEEGFLNFSQNYYPEWKAFIDGVETKIYIVNGSIQGISVPEGSHIVEFKFVPTSFYIGGSITLVVLIIIIVISIYKTKKHRV